MFQKSLKYFLIAGANMFLLTLLLALWADKLVLSFNLYIQQFEFLKIILFTVLTLIALRLQVSWFRKKQIFERQEKIKYSVLLTLLVSSYLYIPYLYKVSENCITHGSTRRHIAERMSDSSLQVKIDSLNYEAYQEIVKTKNFPEIPESASNISVKYYEDGFLPDFNIQVQYEVPLTENIKEEIYKSGQYSKGTTVKIKGNKKIVNYSESEW